MMRQNEESNNKKKKKTKLNSKQRNVCERYEGKKSLDDVDMIKQWKRERE